MCKDDEGTLCGKFLPVFFLPNKGKVSWPMCFWPFYAEAEREATIVDDVKAAHIIYMMMYCWE